MRKYFMADQKFLEKYFMPHQYMSKIFNALHKNSLAPSPTY